MTSSLKQFARLAGFGALAVALGIVALYAFLAWGTRYTPQGGIDHTESLVTMISLSVPFALIIAAHVVYGRQLIRWASER